MIRLPPKVVAATTLVAVIPAAVVWGLRAAGVLTSFIACAALGAVLSLAACQLAARIWERRDGTEDVLFGDLMVWGWIRRCLLQRRLADAVSLLGLRRVAGSTDPLSLSVSRRAELLEQLASDLEARDPYTHGHSRRVARYAAMIGKRMGASREELARIRTAAAVHDIGKLDTPVSVLHKPGRLTDEEFEIVKLHPGAGARMVAILEDERLVEIVRHHHERLDGTGYPDRLAGDEIPLGARIIAVADTFDAITSVRPYRAAKPHRQALEILRAESGSQLDRDVVVAFCSVYAGRRGVGAWVAFTDVAERLVAWLAPDAISSTTRVVALAATTAAVGGGVAALPAFAHRDSRAMRSATGSRVAAVTASRSPSTGGSRLVFAATGGVGHMRSRGSRSGLGAAGHGSVVPLPSGAAAGHGLGKTGPTATGTGAASGSSSGSSSGGSAGGSSGTSSAGGGGVSTTGTTPSPPGKSGLSLSVGATPRSNPTGGLHVTAGSSAGGTTVGVTVGGGSGPGVSAGVTVGPSAGSGASHTPAVGVTVGGSGSSSGVGAQVNIPGVASVKIHLG